MVSLPSAELESLAKEVVRRARRITRSGESTFGELTTCDPDAKWKVNWNTNRQELRLTYVPGSYQLQSDTLHTPHPASAADIPALIALKDACITRMRADGIEQWDEVYPEAAGFARDLAAGTLHVWRTGDHRVGVPTGCVTLDTTHDPLWQGMAWSAAGEPAAVVHRLMVHPALQGRGLAKLLMAHAESLAWAQGFRSIHLDCFTANPAALALYERLGYRRTGTETMRKGPFVCFEKLLPL